MRKTGYWDLYNMVTCILIELAHLIPEYIVSQHRHKTFARLCKVRDGIKQTEKN